MPSRIKNQLPAVRRSRGIGAADLARRVGVSRQTIYAIEAGSYTPNTELALGLARELEVSVEQLFSLATEAQAAPDTIASEVLSAHTPEKGDPVRVGKVGSKWVSVPVSAAPYYLPEADGVIAHLEQRRSKADVLIPSRDALSEKRLVLAGCDPASSLLVHMVEQSSGVEVVSAAASSKLALDWLRAGKVHVAGSHLKDDRTGEFNLPYIRREFKDGDFTVVTFARWEEGLVVAKGNPKGVRRVQDLAKRGVRFVNRELGSGSRALLDRLLKDAGVPASKVDGYERVVRGHLAAAYSVASGQADCCLATRSAAQTFNLAFTPLESERYDLVMRKRTLETPEARALLDVLQRATLRRKLEAVAGYDTAETGTVVA
jgi:molybdate-binding protein/DNA-binding XRE family transcriptional regulator